MNDTNRHFVTVLGTGNYLECVYEAADGKFACKTPFVQIAVLKYVMPEYREGDKITVFVTEEAEKKNWVSDQEPLPTENVKKGLEFLLYQEFSNAKIKSIRIPEGKNKQELDEIFECIYQELSQEEIVYFDFTHGLRNLPMQALAVVNYAKVLKGIKVGGLYYGAFELGKIEKDDLRHVQILDMSSCSSIQDWTSAAEAFVKAGSGNQIYELYQKQEWWIDADKECSDILKSLHDLTNCLETSRGELTLPENEADKTQKSIACAFESFQENFEKMGSKELPVSEQPLKRLFDYIYEDIKPFEKKIYAKRHGKSIELKYTAMGMAVVQWAIKKNLTQQGYTALNETIESYACELYGIAPNVKKERDIVHKAMKGEKRGKWKWGTVYKKEIRKKWAEKWESENSSVNSITAKAVKEMLVELPEKAFYLAKHVAEDRNTLNHFGVINYKERASYQMLQERLKCWYDKMEEILKENYEIVG